MRNLRWSGRCGPRHDRGVSSRYSPPKDLSRYAWLSIGAALATIALKGAAAWLTGSVGLLSDAAESVVNLIEIGRAHV